MRNLTHLIIFGLLAGILLSGCASGSRAFSRGQSLESDGRYEEAMYSYAEAFRRDPDAGEYRLRFLNARGKAADIRFKRGSRLFEQGEYAAALEELRTGFGFEPTEARFEQLIERASRLKDAQQAYQEGLEFEKANKLRDADRMLARAVELNPDNRDYRVAQARILGLRKSRLDGFELSLKSARPITLKFRDARIKEVFNIVTQLSGINFIFDEGVKDQPVTVFLENATFQQALDLLTDMFKLRFKIANESTVIIYPKTPDKTKQYEDLTVRTFHLNYMEAKKAINLIRSVMQVRKIYANEEFNAIVVRDTRDVVEVVEKILEANDVPDAEVVLDVEVLEIGDTDTKTVGLLLSPYSVQMGAYNSAGDLMASTLSAAAKDSSSTSTNNTAQLIKAFVLKGYTGFVTVPTGQYNFAKTLAKSEVLSNPKIRVKNREKSKFNVGKRLPITTTTTTNSTTSVNVQYIDVGVKVTAEPTIELNNEIVIKLSLEVSQDIAKETVGSTDNAATVVTIATRNLETVLSLKDGETSVIGGLIEKNYSNTKKKIYLLSDIPLLGELLTDTEGSNTKSELILAITPRLVRGVTVPPSSLTSFVSGKEDDPGLTRSLASFDQEPLYETQGKPQEHKTVPQPLPQPSTLQPVPQPAVPQPANPPQPLPAPVTSPANTLPASPQTVVPQMPTPRPVAPAQGQTSQQAVPSSVAMPATPGTAATAVSRSVPPVQPVAAARNAPASVQQGTLRIGAPASAALGQPFTLEVKVASVSNLFGAPFVLTYDPKLVEFVSVGEGDFLRKDGASTVFGNAVSDAAGTVSVNLAREPGRPGISGAGTLASLLFRARRKGTATFGFQSVDFTAPDGSPLPVLPFSSAVQVN